MEVSFNELSIPNYENKYEASEGIVNFAKTFNEAKKKGIKKIRSSVDSHEIFLTEDYSLNAWLIDKDFIDKNIYKDLLYSTIIRPFIKEEDWEIEERYLSNYYSFEDKETGFPKTETFGLATSHLYKIIAISFDKLDAFKKNILEIKIEQEQQEGQDQVDTSHNVLNIYSSGCINVAEIKSAIESLGDVILDDSVLSVAEKKARRHLSQHNGLGIQNTFCDSLERSQYVDSIRSTAWGGKKFIKECFDDGTIEIVMHWTTQEFAFLVQTSGKNLRETNEIAKKLAKKYNR